MCKQGLERDWVELRGGPALLHAVSPSLRLNFRIQRLNLTSTQNGQISFFTVGGLLG